MTNRGTCEIYGCRCQKLAPLPSYDWVDAWLVFPLLVSQSVCSVHRESPQQAVGGYASFHTFAVPAILYFPVGGQAS